MKTFASPIFLLLALLFAYSCQKEPYGDRGGEQAPGITVYFDISMPLSPGSTKTRGDLNESAIQDLYILQLSKINGIYRYSNLIKPDPVAEKEDGVLVYSAKIPATSDPLKLFLVANTFPAELASLQYPDTETEIREKLVKHFPDGLTGTIPMFDELELPEGLSYEHTLQASLVRSLARADVYNSAVGNFQLLSARVYRANDLMQMIPDVLSDHKVTAPSVPSGASPSVRTAEVYADYDKIVKKLYFTESTAAEPENRLSGATCVVIGGIFGEDEMESFYRLDFVPGDNSLIYGQVLRNHNYIFDIRKVSGSGWKTPDEAANNLPVNLEVNIQEWDESTHDMVFDGVNHFGVSDREVTMPYTAGSFYGIDVDTSLDTYALHWLGEDGKPNESAYPISPGQISTDPDGLFQVNLSGDGKTIHVKTLSNNVSGEIRTRKLLARAGRLELVLTIRQDHKRTVPRTIYVYGSANGIGRFGDELLGNNSSPDRPAAMVRILKNQANFGSGGTMDFTGFMFGANGAAEIQRYYGDIFDVIYLPYLFNATTSVDFIVDEIIPNPTKVLIVQYDDLNTNSRLLQRLGIDFTFHNSVSPYRLAENLPEFIRDGIFGQLPDNFDFRCYDTSHGEISRATAAAHNITPVLYGGNGGVVLGIDIDRKIVYSGDIDLYMNGQGSNAGLHLSNDGVVRNYADILIANLWAWIADCILTTDPWN